MSMKIERRAFYGVVGLILTIPLVAGSIGAFGGLAGMAVLFGVEDPIVVSPLLANNIRAVSFMFLAWVPLVIWTLASLLERAGAFRITFGCAFLAGFARLTGYLVDGYPGVAPLVFMALELAVMPVLLLWHARLVRLARGRDAERPLPLTGAAATLPGVETHPHPVGRWSV